MRKNALPWICHLMTLVTFTACHQPSPTVAGIPVNEDSVRRHIMPIETAIEYTKRFRSTRDTFYNRVPSLQKAMDLGQAEAFNRDAIAILLNQMDQSGHSAAGLRIYYGLDKDGLTRMILVPYDEKGNDIINTLITEKTVSIPGVSAAYATGGPGQTIEQGQRCPTVCSSSASGLTGGN